MGMLLAMTMAKQKEEEALKKAEIPFTDESAFIPEEKPVKEAKPAKKPVKRTPRKRVSK